MTLVPFTLATPCPGTVITTMPEIAEPLINGARSIVVGVFNGKMKFNALAVGASVPTVIVSSADADVPPGPVTV